MAKKKETHTIYSTGEFKWSMTAMLGRERGKEFNQGKPVEVTKDERDKIKALGRCKLKGE